MINAEPRQPSQEDWHFVKELSERIAPCFRWHRDTPQANEADLRCGVEVVALFPDIDGRLETAYADLDAFLKDAGLVRTVREPYKIITEKLDSGCFECYRIRIGVDSCRIQAGDTEGIRRAIYYLEDLLLGAAGPFLTMEDIQRKPFLKSRISRCFFGPIKRLPLNRDELLDEVDYYPDNYLGRLAHEGINGLWLSVEFRELCRTSFFPAAPDAEKRLNKLCKTVERCLRYGIKIYIFCIEPRARAADDPLFAANPELKGARCLEYFDGLYCFCPFSKTAESYLYEAVNSIFRKVPGLGGMINISFGERPTTCVSADPTEACPICSAKTPGEIISAALTPMAQGMRDAAPDAELISWLYVPGNNPEFPLPEQVFSIAENMPERVVLQYNFESFGTKEQLGKLRHAGDYWLSYVGPSEIFTRVTENARSCGNGISAKIQVGCSHEVATVPLVPVPGLLYQKYKAMRALGVTHVMQCWYFGNYPGIMNKCAGELAFEEFEDSEEDFLLRLARPEWGEHAGTIAEVWKIFGEAYSHYPLDNLFQYYGPMHDGVVWPLYLFPANKPLAPTWKLEYGTSGDRYGECLGGFTLAEALELCFHITTRWEDGMTKLREIEPLLRDAEVNRKDIALAEALGIQFRSGYNILQFYALREKLAAAGGKEGQGYLNQMRKIVEEEILNSERMIVLCTADSRLGFHSEAEGYKYFPEKLTWRIACLKHLIENDFPEAEKRLSEIFPREGFPAIPEKCVKTYTVNGGLWEQAGSFSWKADWKDNMLHISIEDNDFSEGEYTVYLETKRFYPPKCFTLAKGGTCDIPLKPEGVRIRFNIFRKESRGEGSYTGWIDPAPLRERLMFGDYNPAAMGVLILT